MNITVPVLIGFDQSKVIGHLTVDSSLLPPMADFVFTLGVRASKLYQEGSPPESGSYELVCVSVAGDANYAAYLRERGVLGPLVVPNEVD